MGAEGGACLVSPAHKHLKQLNERRPNSYRCFDVTFLLVNFVAIPPFPPIACVISEVCEEVFRSF